MRENSRNEPLVGAVGAAAASTAAADAGFTFVYPVSPLLPPENFRKSSSAWGRSRPGAAASEGGLSPLVRRAGFSGTAFFESEAAGTIGEREAIDGVRLSPGLIDEGESGIAVRLEASDAGSAAATFRDSPGSLLRSSSSVVPGSKNSMSFQSSDPMALH